MKKFFLIHFMFIFLSINAQSMSSHQLALGNQSVALPGIDALNPASIVSLNGTSHWNFSIGTELYNKKLNLSQNYNAEIKSLYQNKLFAVDLSLLWFTLGDVYSQYSFSVSGAKDIMKGISIGAKIHGDINSVKINNTPTTDFCFDVSPGVFYTTTSHFFQAGLFAERLYSSFPNDIIAGYLGFRLNVLSTLSINADYKYQKIDNILSFGIDNWFANKTIALRGGVRLHSSVYDISFGTGIHYKKIIVNYAVVLSQTIENTHHIDINFRL